MTRPRAHRPLPPRLRSLLIAVLTLLLGGAVGRLSTVVVRPPLIPGQDAAYPGARATVTLVPGPQPFLDIRPREGQADTLLIFYPGGLVRPQAYEWLGRALAADGVRTLIPVFPLDLAVLGTDRAGALMERFGKGKRMVIAGHSLGGAMAAGYAAGHPQNFAGLILMAAYPAQNVSLRDAPFPVLSLLAERDGVASAADVRGGLKRLPPGTTLSVLPGAVHAFFGRYGPQRGDGLPTVTREETERRIVRAVRAFLHDLPGK